MSDDWHTTKPDIFADAPAFAKERIRYEIATSRIAGSRLTGIGTSDEDIFVGAGHRDAHEYWQDAMSEPMYVLSFAHLLKQHQDDPSGDPNNLLQISIESALCFARKTGETWFITDPHNPERGPDDLNRLMLHPHRAAEWLLSLPKRKHLVPPALRAFLEQGDRSKAESKTIGDTSKQNKKTGRPERTGYAAQDDILVTEMRKLIDEGKANSLSNAASLVIGKDCKLAAGNGTTGAKISRLVKRAGRASFYQRKTEEK